jgi:hypothetical protein
MTSFSVKEDAGQPVEEAMWVAVCLWGWLAVAGGTAVCTCVVINAAAAAAATSTTAAAAVFTALPLTPSWCCLP